MASLVAFYSRAGENYFGGQYRTVAVGNTEQVARVIAGAVDAPLFHIRQREPYADDYMTCIAQAKRDLQAGARPALTGLPEDFDRYDEIYLGYPNYWGDLPMAVYTFLEALDGLSRPPLLLPSWVQTGWTGKTIHPFCTHEGSGLSGTERKIAAACAGATVTVGLAVPGSRAEACGSLVLRWLNK